jgi:hypothetical protein
MEVKLTGSGMVTENGIPMLIINVSDPVTRYRLFCGEMVGKAFITKNNRLFKNLSY